MANSTVVKHWRDGLCTVKDGTGTPLSVTEKFGQGDFAFNDLSAAMREVVVYRSRGTRSAVRHGEQIEASGSFSVQVAEFTSATATSIIDAALKNGAFAAAVSTLGANAEVYTVDITFTIEGTNFGDSADPTVTFEDCHLVFAGFQEGQPDIANFTWVCYGAIVGDLAV
jgi:hypothetical protein